MNERRKYEWPGRGRELRSTAVVVLVCSWFLGFALAFSPIPVEQLSLDPNSVGGMPWYVGVISMVGAVGWTTALAAAAGGSWIASLQRRAGASSMLRGGALLSALLLANDLFQFHTLPGPLIGVSKSVVLLIYGLLTAWWLVTSRREIIRTRGWLLVVAASLFGLSVLVDQTSGFGLFGSVGTTVAVEDGAKFLGIAMWAQYFVQTSADIIRSVVVTKDTQSSIRRTDSNVEDVNAKQSAPV